MMLKYLVWKLLLKIRLEIIAIEFKNFRLLEFEKLYKQLEDNLFSVG